MNWILFISIWALLGILNLIYCSRYFKEMYKESEIKAWISEQQFAAIGIFITIAFSPLVAFWCLQDLFTKEKRIDK